MRVERNLAEIHGLIQKKKRDKTPKAVDLTRIKPIVASVGFWRFGVNEIGEDLHMPLVNGRAPKRFLTAHAQSKIQFDLTRIKGQHRYFKATAYLGFKGGRVRFRVLADGEELYASAPFFGQEHLTRSIKVKLPRRTKILELIVDDLGNRNSDHSVWIEPRLEN